MKYIIDHDLHIHSELSFCAGEERFLQTNERILKYAEKYNLKTICVTDHFWDEKVKGGPCDYGPSTFSHISSKLPLPQSENIRFLFGCETELNKDLTLGLSTERIKEFDFIIIPTTHLHFPDETVYTEQVKTPKETAETWIKRLDAVLSMNLPFEKVGIAHLTCSLIAPGDREKYLKTLELLSEREMKRLFKKAAMLGCGIEINISPFSDEEADIILRPYKIAKECGCKFYLGSDAHVPREFEKPHEIFKKVINLLDLKEEDKFVIFRNSDK